MTDGAAGTRQGWGLGLWLRLALYCGMLASLVVAPLGLGRTQTALACVVAGVVSCAAGAAWPRSRRALAAAFARSRALRVIDALLWNVALLLVVGEIVLAVAGRLVSSPLLIAPNASEQQRIEESREQVFEYFGRAAGNTRGYNDTEPRSDATDTVRIVALGDSFAYGIVGYEKNFLTRLETKLSERVGRPVEVVNLGLPRLEPKAYLQMLAAEGASLHPDLVLVCLFAGNDFMKVGAATPFDARNWRLVGFVLRVARYAAERARSPDPGAAAAATPKGAVAQPGTFSEPAYLEVAMAYVPFLRRERAAPVQRGYDDTLAVIDEIVARAAPTPVAVAVLPSELQVNPQLRAAALSQLQLREQDLDLDAPARETRAHLEARGVAVIDLLPALVAAERDGNTYAPRDSHWNERGNEVAAEVLAESLEATVRRIAETRSSKSRVDAQRNDAH
jgi:hypothetical protein